MADPAAIDALAKDIAGIESQGNADPYGVVGVPDKRGDRPYGKYQIMGNNIAPWAKEAGLGDMTPQAFLKNPDAQEKIARFKFGQQLDKYGNPKDVASVWHSGVPLDQAIREGRKDALGTTTESYASRVGGGEAGTAMPAPPAAPEELVKLPDGTVVNMTGATAEDRATFKQKVFAKWPELAPKPTEPPAPKVPPTLRDTSVEEAGRTINRELGTDEASSVGKYTAGAFKPAYDAVIDFGRGLMKLPETLMTFTQPSKIQETAETVTNLLHPLAVPAEAAGNVAFQGLTDAGAPPWLSAGVATAVNLIAGAKTPIPGVKAAPTKGNIFKGTSGAIRASETAAEEAAQAAAQAERAAAESGAAAAKAGATPEATARAAEALAPAGVQPKQGAQALEAGLEQRLAEVKEPTQGIYNAYITEHGHEAVDPAQYKGLSEQIADLRTNGRLRGDAAKPIEALESKINTGQKVTKADLNEYKRGLDEVLPGGPPPGASLKERDLYNFKFKVRELMREGVEGDDAAWLNAADTMWRDVIIGKGKPRALGNLVKLVKKDPETALTRLFGNGTSEKQGEMAAAVMKQLEGHAGGADEALRQAMGSRLIKDASDAEGALDPQALLKQYDNLDESTRNAFFTPAAKAFFKTEREIQARAGQAAEGAKTAAQAAKGAASAASRAVKKSEAPNMLAKMTAEGLHFALIGAPLEMVGRHLGIPGAGIFGGVFGRRMIIPPHDIAKFLANSKTANLLTRALKTPANSAVVPAILRQLRDSELGKQLLKSPEGQQKQEEAKQQLAGAK